MSDVYEILKAQGIDKERLDTVLAPKADNWGDLVHAFEVLTVLGAVQSAWPEPEEATYKIVRFCQDTDDDDHGKVIRTGLTLDEAQEHCNDESTHGDGWFDGYTEED